MAGKAGHEDREGVTKRMKGNTESFSKAERSGDSKGRWVWWRPGTKESKPTKHPLPVLSAFAFLGLFVRNHRMQFVRPAWIRPRWFCISFASVALFSVALRDSFVSFVTIWSLVWWIT